MQCTEFNLPQCPLRHACEGNCHEKTIWNIIRRERHQAQTMKWPTDFPHMAVSESGPILLYHNELHAPFAYKEEQWFSVGKQKEGDAERDAELVTDPDILAKLGSAVDYHKRVIVRTRDMIRERANR
jgi:hypothetical protein